MRQLITYCALLIFVVFTSCTKTISDDGENPFINNVNDSASTDSVDPASIQGLHKNIFSARCSNPTCHDGSFEPDFRTIESTYNSLVYQSVIKNDTMGSFKFRVVPYKPESSWLIERLTTEDPVLGRMPIYSTPLEEPEMKNIRDWINNGARDITGKVASYPNTNAEVKYYAAYNFNSKRIDQNRVNGYSSPFIVGVDSTFIIYMNVVDDSTSSSNLLVNQLKLSDDKDDFSNATTLQATYFTSNIWQVIIPSNTFSVNDQVYMRYYVRDPDHADVVEYPTTNSFTYIKENASFLLQ